MELTEEQRQSRDRCTPHIKRLLELASKEYETTGKKTQHRLMAMDLSDREKILVGHEVFLRNGIREIASTIYATICCMERHTVDGYLEKELERIVKNIRDDLKFIQQSQGRHDETKSENQKS